MTDETHTTGPRPIGELRDIADAFIHVPRHHCVPARAWARAPRTAGYWIDRDTDPDTWWRAVHSDTVIVTQLANGTVELNPENAAQAYSPTCSASLPTLVSAGLRHLGVARATGCWRSAPERGGPPGCSATSAATRHG